MILFYWLLCLFWEISPPRRRYPLSEFCLHVDVVLCRRIRFDSRRCKLFENFFFRDVVLCRSLLLNIFWVVIEGELWLRCHDFTKSSFKCCKKSWHDRIVVSTLRCDRSNVTQVRILFEELRIFGRCQNFLIRLLCSIPERCKIKFRSNFQSQQLSFHVGQFNPWNEMKK